MGNGDEQLHQRACAGARPRSRGDRDHVRSREHGHRGQGRLGLRHRPAARASRERAHQERFVGAQGRPLDLAVGRIAAGHGGVAAAVPPAGCARLPRHARDGRFPRAALVRRGARTSAALCVAKLRCCSNKAARAAPHEQRHRSHAAGDPGSADGFRPAVDRHVPAGLRVDRGRLRRVDRAGRAVARIVLRRAGARSAPARLVVGSLRTTTGRTVRPRPLRRRVHCVRARALGGVPGRRPLRAGAGCMRRHRRIARGRARQVRATRGRTRLLDADARDGRSADPRACDRQRRHRRCRLARRVRSAGDPRRRSRRAPFTQASGDATCRRRRSPQCCACWQTARSCATRSPAARRTRACSRTSRARRSCSSKGSAFRPSSSACCSARMHWR